MHNLKRYFLLSVSSMLLLLTGCNGDALTVSSKILLASTMADQVQDNMSMSQTDVATVPYQGSGISAQYPDGWALEEDTDEGLRLFIFAPDIETIDNGPTMTDPFGFFLGVTRILTPDETDADPSDIQREILTDFDMGLTPQSDLITKVDGQFTQISQDFVAEDDDGLALNVTIVTMIHNRRVATLMYGGNPQGLDEHGASLLAIAETIELEPFPRVVNTTSGEIDFEDPVSVLQAVFDAAISQDYDNLSSLCDPLGENDGDTAMVCEIHEGHEVEPQFIEYFTTGEIIGDPMVNGDEAEVPFIFGPPGEEDEETMNFILRDGKWYLYSF